MVTVRLCSDCGFQGADRAAGSQLNSMSSGFCLLANGLHDTGRSSYSTTQGCNFVSTQTPSRLTEIEAPLLPKL